MASRQACGKCKVNGARTDSSWGDAPDLSTNSLWNDLEWSDATGRYLAANNLTPAGATHTHKGLFYKKGTGGRLCYWNGLDWVRSSKRASLLVELFPYRNLASKFTGTSP